MTTLPLNSLMPCMDRETHALQHCRPAGPRGRSWACKRILPWPEHSVTTETSCFVISCFLQKGKGRLEKHLLIFIHKDLDFPGGSDGVESACNAGGPGFDPWDGTIPWRREWPPTRVFLPGESHGQRSPGGYGPQGHKESDTTERLTLSLSG